jgi:small subunit ribosomal protein S4
MLELLITKTAKFYGVQPMNYIGPKVRISRRLGIAITPKAARIMEKRGFPPGQHGQSQTMRKRESDYAKQLLEKQRLRAQYSLTERRLRNYVFRATNAKGVTGEVLLQILESRLDAFVLRAGFARTIYAARQMVTHGHFVIDGKKINLPGYELKPGQVVSVRERSRKSALFTQRPEGGRAPAYISADLETFQARLLTPPIRTDVPIIVEEQLVIEYYSR